MLAEDNEINQQVATELLEIAGVRVTVANNGVEAVYAVGETEFDAVLMDIQMPEMGGFEATEKIRSDERFAELPIIAMTAHAMSGDREKFLAAGMSDHVTKPVDPDALYSALERLAKPKASKATVVKEVGKGKEAGDLPELDGIDVEAGLKRVAGNQKLYRKLLLKFKDMNAETVQGIEAAIKARDWEAGRALTHGVKGVAGNLGVQELYETATRLETILKEERVEDMEAGLEGFSTELERVVVSIASLEPRQ